MHVIHKIQCFEEFLHYFALFFKKLIFPEFRPIKSVFQPIGIAFKMFMSLYLFRSVLDWC